MQEYGLYVFNKKRRLKAEEKIKEQREYWLKQVDLQNQRLIKLEGKVETLEKLSASTNDNLERIFEEMHELQKDIKKLLIAYNPT